jgi:hypothetical protein
VQALKDGRWWIYLSTRDAAGKSRIGRLTVDPAPLAEERPPRVLQFDPTPVLSLGAPGTFDDSGVMPSSLVQHQGEQWLYYVGWNVLNTVPYRQAIGLAISKDGGRTFERFSAGPLFDRSASEPFFVTSPFVRREGDAWRMWYISCTGWQLIADHWEPAYHVRYAESGNGIDWNVTGRSCLYPGDDAAIARPCVYRQNDEYGMIYPYRALVAYRSDPDQAYRLGYAHSRDGIDWQRRDEVVGIARSPTGWDSQMLAYPWLQCERGEIYMLYNGNGFGRSGVGVARLVTFA